VTPTWGRQNIRAVRTTAQEPHTIRAPKCQAAKNPRMPGTRGIATLAT
jgi:hypothetical protein